MKITFCERGGEIGNNVVKKKVYIYRERENIRSVL